MLFFLVFCMFRAGFSVGFFLRLFSHSGFFLRFFPGGRGPWPPKYLVLDFGWPPALVCFHVCACLYVTCVCVYSVLC